jgi:hypothetical protein
MIDLIDRVADIKRRLRGLKSVRPSNLSQVRVFEVAQSFNITLQAAGSPGDQAVFLVTINCSGTPFYSVALDDFILFPVKIVPRNNTETVVGNTVTRYIIAKNLFAGIVNETVTVRGFALNGLSGSITRTS